MQPTQPSPHRVLIVEDDFAARGMFSTAFELKNIQVDVAEDGIEAMRLLTMFPHRYCVALLDLNVPPPDGIHIAQYIRDNIPDLPVIVVTGDDKASERIRDAELSRTVRFVVHKPTVPIAIVGCIHGECVRRRQQRTEGQDSRENRESRL